MINEDVVHQEEDLIIETLPSGVKMIIVGTPSIDRCKEFLKILLKANRNIDSEST